MRNMLAFLLLMTPAFALDRTIIKDARGKTVGGIVSKNGRAVVVDSKGHVVGVGTTRWHKSAIVMRTTEPYRTSRPSSVYPKMPSWKK